MESERDRLIRAKAYQLWEEGGRRDGSAEDNWAEAERSVSAGGGSPENDVDGSTAAAPARKSRKVAPAATTEAEAHAAKAPRGTGKAKAKGGTAKA